MKCPRGTAPALFMGPLPPEEPEAQGAVHHPTLPEATSPCCDLAPLCLDSLRPLSLRGSCSSPALRAHLLQEASGDCHISLLHQEFWYPGQVGVHAALSGHATACVGLGGCHGEQDTALPLGTPQGTAQGCLRRGQEEKHPQQSALGTQNR